MRDRGSGERKLGQGLIEVLALAAGGGVLVCSIEDDLGDALELDADGEHALDACVLVFAGQHLEEADDEVHEPDVGAGARVLGVLQDVAEEGHEGGDGEVED
jgi:hypothetical protein